MGTHDACYRRHMPGIHACFASADTQYKLTQKDDKINYNRKSQNGVCFKTTMNKETNKQIIKTLVNQPMTIH